jgi:hypothetical protein
MVDASPFHTRPSDAASPRCHVILNTRETAVLPELRGYLGRAPPGTTVRRDWGSTSSRQRNRHLAQLVRKVQQEQRHCRGAEGVTVGVCSDRWVVAVCLQESKKVSNRLASQEQSQQGQEQVTSKRETRTCNTPVPIS